MRSDILFEKINEGNSKAKPKRYKGHLGYIWTLLKWNDKLILSGGRDKTIRVWGSEGKCVQKF